MSFLGKIVGVLENVAGVSKVSENAEQATKNNAQTVRNELDFRDNLAQTKRNDAQVELIQAAAEQARNDARLDTWTTVWNSKRTDNADNIYRLLEGQKGHSNNDNTVLIIVAVVILLLGFMGIFAYSIMKK